MPEAAPPPPEVWPPGVPDVVWAPLVSGMLVVIIGALSIASGMLWLFASVGPTVYIQTTQPQGKPARCYDVVVGHFVGIAAGYLALLIVGAQHAPSVFVTHHPVALRMWASAVAVVLDLAGDLVLKASHAPAAATTLLIALGAFRWKIIDAVTIATGVVLIAVLGEVARAVRLKQRPFFTCRP